MLLDGSRNFLHRIETRSDRPAVPAIEDELPPVMGRSVIDLLKGEPKPIGTRRFEMQARELRERCDVRNGEAALVLEPKVSAVLEFGPFSAFGAPDLVYGIVDQLDGVELVEGDATCASSPMMGL